MRVVAALVFAALLSLLPSQAFAKKHHYTDQGRDQFQPWFPGWQHPQLIEPRTAKRRVVRHRKAHRSRTVHQQPKAKGIITVSTAAGIDIKVNPAFAPKIVAFIKDLVDEGYKPKQIHCHANGGHVRGSRHYSGAACDIDQTGWGKTAPKMYHVAALAKKHGLRDGGSFRDWGHIDDGQRLTRMARVARTVHVARVAAPQYVLAGHPRPEW